MAVLLCVLQFCGQVTRNQIAVQHHPAGRVTATIDARANNNPANALTSYETDTSYDAANRVTDVYQPSVPVSGGSPARPHIHTDYDADGNPVHVFDANNHETINTYDFLNRLLTTEDAANITVTNGYDQVGNKLSVKDGNLHTTNFAYDGLNRNTSVTDAAGRSTQLRYDGLNKTQRIDALGQTTTYLYDVRNRLQYVVYASGAAANSQRNYAYDNVGNLLSVTEPSKTAANVAYTYDALNRAITETSGSLTHTYVYDLAGNRLQTVYGGTSRTITSTYDALNRLSTMTESGRETQYAYDLNGNIAKKTAPNGDVEATSFDALNRAQVESAQTVGASSLFSYTYGYDLVGNVLSVAETYPSGLGNRTVGNTYDAINRLDIEAVTASTNVTTTYAYDNANNRLSKSVVGGSGAGTTNYSYNNLNQLTGYSEGTRSVSLSYDNDGNRTSRTVSGGSDNGTDTYSYDFENRLIGLVKGTSGGSGTYAYQYDYRTRRITRDESSAGGNVTSLVFSGGTSVQEYDNGASTPTVEYIRGSDYGGGVGGILYTLRGGTPSYTHENKRGDVVAKTDANGSLTYQARYEAFGKQVATTGSTLDRQKSNSKDTDPTGLVDEGFRYRDLETGMFINRDPAGFVDGPNLYTYVVQNPWTKFDPEGLTPLQAPEVAAGAVERIVVDLAKGADKALEGAGYLGEKEVLAAPAQIKAVEGAAKELGSVIKENAQAAGRGAEVVATAINKEAKEVAAAVAPTKSAAATTKPGRRGSAETQADINVQRDKIQAQNPDWVHTGGGTDAVTGQPVPETYVPGAGGGTKGSTYPDLTFKKPDGTSHYHNTVDTKADGKTLTTRESNNLTRLQTLRPKDTTSTSAKP